MITLTCPSCAAKSTLGDEFAGRKAKCPKCGTRVRHLPDGTFELLSVGQAPPAPASPSEAPAGTAGAKEGPLPGQPAASTATAAIGSSPPGADPPPVAAPGVHVEVRVVVDAPAGAAPSEALKSETPVAVPIIPELAGKLVSQSESKQNTIVVGGVAGCIVLTLSVMGLVMGNLTFAVAPIAVAFVVAFGWLSYRMRGHKAPVKTAPAPKPPAPAAKDGEKTEAIPKA